MDPQEFREAGHRIVDHLADYLEQVEERPLFANVEPRVLRELFDEPLPQEPSSIHSVLLELNEKLLPYCTQVNHPGYFGLITPSPTPVGILGDFIASALNQNLGAYSIGPSAVAMERRTVRWLTDLAGYGPDAGGNLTSGGMMANFVGLKLARDWASGDRAPRSGTSRWTKRRTPWESGGRGCGCSPPMSTSRFAWSRWRLPSRRIDRRGSGRWPSSPWAGAPTRVQWTRSRSCERSPTGRSCGCTWTPPTGAACCSHRSTRESLRG